MTATLPVEYNKQANIEMPAPLEGVIPDISVKYVSTFTYSSATKTPISQELTLNNAGFNEQPDERLIVYPVPVSGEATLEGDSQTLKVTNAGKLTPSVEPTGDSITTIAFQVDISDVSSVKAVTVSHPTRIDDESYTVEVYCSNDGSTWVLKAQLTGYVARPITVQRKFFYEYTHLRIKVIFESALAVSSTSPYNGFLRNIDPFNVMVDFKNSAESLLIPAMFGLIMGVSTAGLDWFTSQLTNDSRLNSIFKAIASDLGIAVKDQIGSFVAAMTYAVSKGWIAWDQITIDLLIQVFSSTYGMYGLGLTGAQIAIGSIFGQDMGKSGVLLNALFSGGAGFLMTTAYLTVLSIHTRHVYVG